MFDTKMMVEAAEGARKDALQDALDIVRQRMAYAKVGECPDDAAFHLEVVKEEIEDLLR